MVEIGEHPILWHIMKIYAAHGFDDFVIATRTLSAKGLMFNAI
jgi:NDP-sugar pyrophosphorylase family protein